MALFILLGGLFALLVRSFLKFYREEQKLMSPHPIMLFALGAQVMAIFFGLVHWWYYSDDGEGSRVCDIFSKVFGGIASVTMSILLIMMASGWKLNY